MVAFVRTEAIDDVVSWVSGLLYDFQCFFVQPRFFGWGNLFSFIVNQLYLHIFIAALARWMLSIAQDLFLKLFPFGCIRFIKDFLAQCIV